VRSEAHKDLAGEIIVRLVVINIATDYFSREAHQPQPFSGYPTPLHHALFFIPCQKKSFRNRPILMGVAMPIQPVQGGTPMASSRVEARQSTDALPTTCSLPYLPCKSVND
jgi:hypothetical protein